LASAARPARVPGAVFDLPSLPTRRSSDLHGGVVSSPAATSIGAGAATPIPRTTRRGGDCGTDPPSPDCAAGAGRSWIMTAPWWRSEEHTSELQSRFDLVCRLLLETKQIAT